MCKVCSSFGEKWENERAITGSNVILTCPLEYRLTNWMFLCGQVQSPRPDVMPDRIEGIARAEGFVAARIETSSS